MEQLKQSTKLFADETTAPVLDPGRGRVKKGQLWAYARDERPWTGRAPPGVAYVYAPDRKHARPAEHLAGFSGILQVDGYGAYAELAQRGDVTLAFCWSHVRRQFYDIQVKTPAPIAPEALVRIAALYAAEAEIRGLTADERRQARQRRTKPLVDALHASSTTVASRSTPMWSSAPSGRSRSSAISLPNSVAEPGSTVPPNSLNRALNLGSTRPALISALSFPMDLWLEVQLAAVSGKSTIAGAIRYALSRWDGLTRVSFGPSRRATPPTQLPPLVKPCA
jgi:hypothetical protein